METTRNYSIPPIDRVEWKDLVTSKIDHQFQNFVLQMKTDQFNRQIQDGNISIQDAVNGLHQLCSKYVVAVQGDIKKIFKDW